MRKLIRFILILSLFLGLMAIAPRAANQPSAQAADLKSLYLPMIKLGGRSYTVSGQVVDAANVPMAGVTITDRYGRSAVTNASGNYSLAVIEGENALAVFKDGVTFAPTVKEVQITGNLSGQNFQAAACYDAMAPHGGFETLSWWNFPASPAPAAYDNLVKHTGTYSVRTGGTNIFSYSTVRTPEIAIPVGASSVTFRVWSLQYTTESTLAPLPSRPYGSFDELRPPADGPSSVSAYDAQYVVVLSPSNDILEILYWDRENDPAWVMREFDLTKWAGWTIRLQMGVYNDGNDGVTTMYVDDASLAICDGGVPPVPSCSEIIVDNSFEEGLPYSAYWVTPATAYTAARTYSYAHTGLRSMRTGIPLETTHDVLSYSEAQQQVTIPVGTTIANLSVWLWPQTEEPYTPSKPLAAPDPNKPASDQPLGDDVQYIIVYDPAAVAPDPVYRYLLWEKASQNHKWINRQYDLSMYAGKTVTLVFGVYNDGDGYSGRTVMYVDDVVLEACTGVLPPPPPPPPVPICEERIVNGGMEGLGGWYIPITEWTAGYSSFLSHTGLWSMRTGIYYTAHNRYSYSDFGQVVTIPWWADGAYLEFYEYSRSGEALEVIDLPDKPTAVKFGAEAMAGDVQYLLILDIYGNWIDTLLWQRENDQAWEWQIFDLSPYVGWTIRLQWGTYNNGYSGVTSMYVDDVSLGACVLP